jgi:hypothetical protein
VCGFLAAWRILDGLKRAAKPQEERWHNIVSELPPNVVLLKVNSRLSRSKSSGRASGSVSAST